MTATEARAYRLGSIDAYAGRPERDMADSGSAWLMTELGQDSPTTAANADARGRMCDAYTEGYCDARRSVDGQPEQDHFAADHESGLVGFHGLAYWAGVVERLREEIRAQL